MKRREMLAGIGSLLVLGTGGQMATAQNAAERSDEANIWKYAKIDPAKVADMTYDIYSQGACMYAVTRALLTNIAEALRPLELMSAIAVESFPIHMMRYGRGGIGSVGSACGAFNGCAAVIGLFVHDAVPRDAMIRELCVYYESTALPKYKPKEDMFPNMETSVSGSVLCHISSSRWSTKAKEPMYGPKRSDRCKRLSADIAAKTAELLNRYHADKSCAFTGILEPTKTCFECHGSGGEKADILGTSTCATCHEHNDTHINKFLKRTP